jgi:2-dehydro-3-deoxygluconokinase
VDNVIDAVGVGDACCAALLDALSKYGEDYQSVIEFAMSASALKNTIPGDFNLVSEEEVLTLMGGNTSGRVLR